MSYRKIKQISKPKLILLTCFILTQSVIYSQNLTSSNGQIMQLNNTISNMTNMNNSNSKSQAILLSKTLMTITDNCQDNPMLPLLRIDFKNNIIDTLYDQPEESNQDYCKRLGEKTCCSASTYDVFLNEFNNLIFPNRQKIFKKNMNIYTRIIDEHYRNFFKYYDFDDEQFYSLFSDYDFYVRNITQITESIVKKSMLFKWNNLCNFVCYPHLNQLCKVYNVTYLYNDTLYYDLNYDCEMKSNPSVLEIQNLLNYLNTQFKTINSTIEMFYSYVHDNLERVSKINQDTFNLTSNNETFSLLKNSLQDGLYVSKKITNNFQCGDRMDMVDSKDTINPSKSKITVYKNYFVPQNELYINATCQNILENVCQPFECLDNFFLQFNDDSVADSQNYLIYSNITKVNLSPYSRSTDLFSFYDKDSISLLINSTIQFANSAIRSDQYIYRIIFFILLFIYF